MATNTARKLNTTREFDLQQREYEVLIGKKKNRRRNILKSGLFLAASLFVLSGAITYYLSLQSEITALSKEISVKERTLNELKLDNDETYSRINSSVDIDEIRRVAIQELGMKYAEENQVIIFDGDGSDYVRQTGAIPSANGNK